MNENSYQYFLALIKQGLQFSVFIYHAIPYVFAEFPEQKFKPSLVLGFSFDYSKCAVKNVHSNYSDFHSSSYLQNTIVFIE